MEKNNPNLTAEDYGIWMITTMATLPEGPEYEHLQMAFHAFNKQISYLERCYRL